MTGKDGRARAAVTVAAIAIALVAGLPWLGAFGAGASVFGFPLGVFLVVLLGPVLLALLVGTVSAPDDAHEDTAP